MSEERHTPPSENPLNPGPGNPLDPDHLPTDGAGDTWVPWYRAEEAGLISPENKEVSGTLAEILATRGIGLVKFGAPEFNSMYNEQGDDERTQSRQTDAHRRGVPEAQGRTREEQHEDSVADILDVRATRDGNHYIQIEPWRTPPGRDSLKPSAKGEQSVRSRHGVQTSPRVTTASVGKEGRPETYKPRIIEGAGLAIRAWAGGWSERFGKVHTAVKDEARHGGDGVSDKELQDRKQRAEKAKAARKAKRRKL